MDCGKLVGVNPLAILLIESHAAARRALVGRLQLLDQVVVTSKPALPDSYALQQLKPDLAIFSLPRRSDRPKAYLQSSVRRLANVAPTILLSSYLQEQERVYMTDAGASHYLLKQPNSVELVTLIEAYRHSKLSSARSCLPSLRK